MAATIGAPVEAALKPPDNVNAGDTSEAMLRKLDDFAKFMGPDKLGFLYDKWRNHQCALPDKKARWNGQPVFGKGWQENGTAGGGSGDGEAGGMYQLKIINWGLMWGARGRLANLHSAADALQTASDQVFQKIHGAWTSKAGDAAAGKFNDFRAAAQAYGDQVQTLFAQMEGARNTTRAAIEKLANFGTAGDGGKSIMDKHSGDGSDNEDASDNRELWSTRMDEMDTAIRNGTLRWGPEAHEVYSDGAITTCGRVDQNAQSVRWAGQVYLTDGDNIWADQACNWLDDMAEMYFQTIGTFRRQIEETITTVKKAWSTLYDNTVNIAGTPFDKLTLSADSGGGNNGKDQSGGKDQDTRGGGKHTGGTDTAGSDSGGSDSGVGSHAQQPPPPPIKGPDDHTGTQPSDTGEGTVRPPGTSPGQQPPGGGQQPQSQQHESVTIQAGDQKITVDSPDGQGHVKLTVDDGSGKPKTYDVDFSGSNGTGQDPTGTGQHSQGRNGQGFGPTGQDVTQQHGQGFGPTGQDPNQPHTLPAPDGQGAPGGDGQVQHAVAGPDGKAVIHDGNVTITAEQPPGSDQIKITVDDGAGHTSTYLVDYDDPTNPQVQPGGPAPQANGFAGTGDTGGGGQHAAPTGGAHAEQAQPASYAPTDHVQQPSPAADQVWSEPQEQPLATHAQSSFAFDGAADSNAADGAWSTQGDLLDGHPGQPDQQQVAPAAGDAGLATVPDGQGHPQQGAGSPMGGGMPMMGAMGGGGGGGGDQERGPSTWSTTGDLFDEGPRVAADQISSVLDGEGR